MTLHAIWPYIIPLALLIWGAIKAKAIKEAIDWCWNRIRYGKPLTVELREVGDDKHLVSISTQLDRYTVNFYIFLRVWVVNTNAVPTVPKEWVLNITKGKDKLKAEPVPDFSKWHQHTKVEKEQQGFKFIEDIREKLPALSNQPLQQGIPSEGWICFLVRDTEDSLLNGSTLHLTLIDSFGRKHPLKANEPWNIKGSMVNPEKLW